MNPHRRALIEIHVCVVLWGFTAILGKLITLPAPQLVWWRMLLVSAALACVPRVWRALARIPAREAAVFAGIGCVVALHWLAFYASVKLANASVAATTMALAPVVTALIEPAITGARFERHNLLLGILVIPGVALVIGGIPDAMHVGLLGRRRLRGAGGRLQRAQQALPGPSRCARASPGSSLVRDSC